MRRKTHKKFIEEMKEKHPEIKVLGTYVNNKTKIECLCNICKTEWSAFPNNLLQKTGCPQCGINKQRMPIQEFLNKLHDINPDIDILGDYINSQTKLLCKCKICNNEWKTKPTVLLRGCSCPKCGLEKISEKNGKTHETFINEMSIINPNILITGKYRGNREKVECLCKLDGCTWSASPFNLLQNYGCPQCGENRKSEKLLKSHNQFVNELSEKQPDIQVISEYKGLKYKILCKCKKCNHEWKANPNSLLSANTGCPKCNFSKGENIIYNFLSKNKINNIQQKTFDDLFGIGGGKLSYDFYLPIYNVLIEFQGLQHYQAIKYFGGNKKFEYQQEHDRRKREYAKLHNIELIEIPYWDLDNIETILENKLFKISA